MTPVLLDCALRAALIVAGTAVVLWLMRIRRPATRHAAWTAAVVAMLVLPIWSASGPRLSLRLLQPAPAPVAASPSSASASIALPPVADDAIVDAGLTQTVAPSDAGTNWLGVLAGAYLFGAAVLLLRLMIGTVYAIRLRRDATLRDGRATSGQCAAPITVGWLSPTLILPSGWERWPAAKLNAVLQHEGEHARRRDPLVQWVALFNRAVFWFHPFAWWLERRLAVLAEESCDAVVLAAGCSPQEYSDYLLDLARSVTMRGGRIRAVGMAMPGSGLNERMHRILADAPAPVASRVRVMCTAALCAASTVLFAGSELAHRAPAPSDGSDRIAADQNQAGAAVPKFGVVSVKPCAAGRGGRAGGGDQAASPGRVVEDCMTPLALVQEAYLHYANGRANPPWTARAWRISGEPDWFKSDRYRIEAVADGTPSGPAMLGPMMQGVLEDRFKLKVHRETRDVPVYEIHVATGGSKLSPFTEGTCVPVDWTLVSPPPLGPGQRRCKAGWTMESNKVVWDVEAMSLDELASMFYGFTDRPLVDATGIAGLVKFHVEYDMGSPGDQLTSDIFAAFKQQLGLELLPARARLEFLVIDHAERPTPNDAAARSTGAGTSRR